MEQLRIEIEPSFQPPETFEISVCSDVATNPPSFQFTFSMCLDDHTMRTEEGYVLLSDSQYQRIVEQFKKIRIGILPEYAMGLDGTTTRITITQGWNEIQMEWWPEAPKEWRSVERLVKFVRKLAKEEVAKPGR